MEATLSEQQLLQSCQILFGSHLAISRDFLDYLQPSGLKSAYRKRAMEVHPDRFAVKDRMPQQLINLSFSMVQDAYENLLCFLKNREKIRSSAGSQELNAVASPARQQNTKERPRSYGGSEQPFPNRRMKPATFSHNSSKRDIFKNIESLYQGPFPRRQLLFGHFLYYSGLVSWQTIARTLTWQRIGRPRLGELSLRFGMLKSEGIISILQNKVPFQPFGQTAIRLGLLNEYQLRILLLHQQRIQKKFGTILLENNIINDFELHNLLYKFKQHNEKHYRKFN